MNVSDNFFTKLYSNEKGKSLRGDEKGGEVTHLQRDDAAAYLRMCKFQFREYTSGGTFVDHNGQCYNNRNSESPSGNYSIEELRAYAQDAQSITQYQEILMPGGVKGLAKQQKGSLLNIDFTLPAVASPILSEVAGKFDEVEFEYEAEASDLRGHKERLKNKAALQTTLSPEMQQLYQEAGMRPDGELSVMGVDNLEDLEIVDKLGGLRLQAEIDMDNDIDHSLNHSDYPTVVSSQIKDDLMECGVASTKVVCDPITKMPTIHRVDIAGLVVPRSKYRDFRDVSRIAEVTYYTIHELRGELIAKFEDEDGMDYDMAKQAAEEGIVEIVKNYKACHGRLGGSGISGTGETLKMLGTGRGNDYHDDMKILVMDSYFIATETERFMSAHHRKSGTRMFKPVRKGHKLSKRDVERRKAKHVDLAYQHVFRAMWVVGTEILVRYGVEYGTVRAGQKGMKSTQIPISVYTTGRPSMVHRMIPHINDIVLATYKTRDSLSKMMPSPAMAIDISRIEPTVEIGKTKYQIHELLGMAYQSGILFYQSRPDLGIGQTGGKPIEPVSNAAVVEQLNLYISLIERSGNELMKVTGGGVGHNTVAPSDLPVGVMKGVEAATNKALKPIFVSYRDLSTCMAKYLMLKWQLVRIDPGFNADILPVTGRDGNLVNSFSEDVTSFEFGMKVNLKPTERDREEMTMMLMGQKEKGLIGASDYFVMKRLVARGKMREVEFYFAVSEKRRERDQMEQKMKIDQNAAQANMQATQIASQAELAKIKANAEAEIMVEEAKAKFKVMAERQLIALKAQLDGEQKGALAGIQLAQQMDQQGPANEQPSGSIA